MQRRQDVARGRICPSVVRRICVHSITAIHLEKEMLYILSLTRRDLQKVFSASAHFRFWSISQPTVIAQSSHKSPPCMPAGT